jgi:hypothetical protein
MTKTCFKCGEEQPIECFYTHKAMADGHLNKCKSCTRQDVAERIFLKKNDPQWVLKERERCRIKARRDVRFPNPAQKAEYIKRYSEKHPEKKKAHTAVSNAIRDGRLFKQPCEVCFSNDVEAHHDDYSKPLDVRWLCVKHHAEHHVKEREKVLLIPF